jgi:hypothetical protein
MSKRDPRLKAYVKIDLQGQVVPGTLVMRKHKPEGRWLEIIANVCCTTTSTTSTTTTSTTTTTTSTSTTTTTTAP